MAALILVVCLGLAVGHWLLEPLSAPLLPVSQLQPLPWLALGVVVWLLAGRPER